MDFQTFHLYNRLVRRGLTKPLSCQHCKTELTLAINDKSTDPSNPQPMFECFGCGVKVYPGLDMYSRCRAVVKEHFP